MWRIWLKLSAPARLSMASRRRGRKNFPPGRVPAGGAQRPQPKFRRWNRTKNHKPRMHADKLGLRTARFTHLPGQRLGFCNCLVSVSIRAHQALNPVVTPAMRGQFVRRTENRTTCRDARNSGVERIIAARAARLELAWARVRLPIVDAAVWHSTSPGTAGKCRG